MWSSQKNRGPTRGNKRIEERDVVPCGTAVQGHLRYEVAHSRSAHGGTTAELKAHVVAVGDFWQVREERGWKR